MTEKEKSRIIDLREKGISFGRIAQQLNLSKSTVSTFYTSYQSAKGKCKYCGCSIINNRKRVKLFCSDKCRSKWWNEHKKEIDHKTVYSFVCNCCGKEFTRIQNKNYKYCSYECFQKSRGEHHEG